MQWDADMQTHSEWSGSVTRGRARVVRFQPVRIGSVNERLRHAQTKTKQHKLK